MGKNRRQNWQAKGFKSFREYQQHQQKAKLQSIFAECLQEAADCHETIRQQRNQEATDRLKYHNLRLQELANGTHYL